jgi:hypothetical protein
MKSLSVLKAFFKEKWRVLKRIVTENDINCWQTKIIPVLNRDYENKI